MSRSPTFVAALAQAEREGRLRDKIRFFCRAALLIVDEIGYLPVIPDGGSLFFQLVNARYERGAMILTSNRGFAEWGEIFGDPVVATALLDRLLHHAVVIQIEGSSYRLRQHAELVPEHIRSKALITPPLPAPPRRAGRPSPKTPLQPAPDRPRAPSRGKFTSALLRKVCSALTYLTLAEVERLIAAAKPREGRYGHRDATLILIAYRHGLRVRELVAMRCDQLDFHQGSSTSAG